MTNRLQWEVFVSAQIPVVTNDFARGTSGMKWSPISSRNKERQVPGTVLKRFLSISRGFQRPPTEFGC
jgi:hypothetical protein